MAGDSNLHHPTDTSNTPPPAVAAWLDGSDLENKTTAIGVITADPDGWPHPAQLSAGEILLSSDGEVRLAVHADSGMADNLRRDGRVVLMLAADGANNELRFEVTEGPPLADPPLATFTGQLIIARAHRVPYAEVTRGVQYTLHDPDGTLQRLRRQIDALRALKRADHTT